MQAVEAGKTAGSFGSASETVTSPDISVGLSAVKASADISAQPSRQFDHLGGGFHYNNFGSNSFARSKRDHYLKAIEMSGLILIATVIPK